RDKVKQSLGFEGLFDEIERAAADCSDRRVEPAVARNHDNRKRQIESLDGLDKPQTVEARTLQPDVDQSERWASLTDGLKRCITVGGSARLIAFILHDAGHQFANVAFVVDDQNIKRHGLPCPVDS